MRNRWLALAAALLLATLALVREASATPQADKCRATKLKAAARKAQCVLDEDAKAVLGRPANPARCDEKLGSKFGAAEAKGGEDCPTTGDAAAIAARVDTAAAGVDQALAGPRFVDNGDGTVSDTRTGLMWEKKDDSGGLHDKDASYTWTDAMSVWLSELNGRTDVTNPKTPGFAGYSDWRLPDIDELQTILLAPSPCPTSPCIDSIFGPTSADTTLSSSSALSAGQVWSVNFADGHLSSGVPVGNFNHVRAVRGGL